MNLGLGLKFYNAFVCALALHVTALVGLYFAAMSTTTPTYLAEKSVTVNFAVAPEAEYFQSSAQPQVSSVAQEIAPGTKNSGMAKAVSDINAKGKRPPRNYLERLQVSVQEASHLPEAVRKYRLSGNAVLRLQFTRGGSVLNYALVQESGNRVIDKAAINTGKKLMAQKFPPAPRNFDYGQQILTYDFPISFNSREL